MGVHHGIAFVGAVMSEGGTADITVLGDTTNVAARLAALTAAGEMLISDAARQLVDLDPGGMELQKMDLKGRTDSIDMWIRKI